MIGLLRCACDPIYTESDPRTYAIIGVSMAVHRELGCGSLEPIYQEALALEFTERDIPFVRELQLSLAYKGKQLKTRYSPDFICYGSVVVELKALNRVGGIEQAQVINYLKAMGHEIGLLINFGPKEFGTP